MTGLDIMPAMNPSPDHLPGAGRIVVAFSGGPDSMCLLHQLAASGCQRPLACIHVDHGLDDDSAARARRAHKLASKLGIDCTVISIEVSGTQGPEANARKARYGALEDQMQPGDALLTGHHADDQAETVLLRLLRGAGPAGLAGMPRVRNFAGGWLVRPLLDWRREDIERYITDHQLEVVHDPSNHHLTYDRNFLRHQVLPLLQQRWPGVRRALLRSAGLNRGAGDALQALARIDLDQCREDHWRLRVAPLGRMSDFRIGQLLQRWCHECELTAPPGRMLESFIGQLESAASDQLPQLRWSAGVMRRWNGFLWLSIRPEPVQEWQFEWAGSVAANLPAGLGRLELRPHGSELPALKVSSGTPGERIRLPGRTGHHKVTQLLAEHGVPPWQRPLWPRLWRDDHLLAVGERWLDADFERELAKRNMELTWHTDLPGSMVHDLTGDQVESDA